MPWPSATTDLTGAGRGWPRVTWADLG